MKNAPYPYYEIAEVPTLRDLIAYGRDQGGNNTIFYGGKRNTQPISFKSAYHLVEALGTFLLNQELRDAKIALLGENSTEWCLSYFAIVSTGNVVVPLDKELPREDLAELIRHCGCQAIIFSKKYTDVADYFHSLDDLSHMLYFTINEFDAYVTEGEYLMQDGDRSFAETTVTPDTLACIVYTSGTSGKSKGVMLSHGNLASDVVATCQCVTARNTQIFLPMNHTFSWASAMFAAFLYNVDAHISGSMKRIVKDLNQNKPQNISAVPLMVEMLYNGIWVNAKKQGMDKKLRHTITLSQALMICGIDLRKRLFRRIHEHFGGKLETIICGGAALDPKLQKGLYDFGITVINGYGITECSPVVLGYYKDPEATAEAFDGEWFKTGDYGYIDKDGFLFITGRKKNLIILANGKNVSPEELEEKLRRLEYVKEVAVYEEDKTVTGEFYLDTMEYPDAPERLQEDVRLFNSSMPSCKNIQKVKLRSAPFEKTTTMKIKRYLLAQPAGKR